MYLDYYSGTNSGKQWREAWIICQKCAVASNAGRAFELRNETKESIS
jgi:hypothetical protein